MMEFENKINDSKNESLITPKVLTLENNCKPQTRLSESKRVQNYKQIIDKNAKKTKNLESVCLVSSILIVFIFSVFTILLGVRTKRFNIDTDEEFHADEEIQRIWIAYLWFSFAVSIILTFSLLI